MGSNPLSLEALSHYFPDISAPVIAEILQQADSEMTGSGSDPPATVNWDARDATVLQHLLLLSEGNHWRFCAPSYLLRT